MLNFDFYNPTHIVFGKDRLAGQRGDQQSQRTMPVAERGFLPACNLCHLYDSNSTE